MSDNLCAVCGQAPRKPLANVCQSCSDEIERRQARRTCPACEAAARELADLRARLAALAAELPARTWERIVCADEDAEQTWSQIRPLLTGLIAAELRALLRKEAGQ